MRLAQVHYSQCNLIQRFEAEIIPSDAQNWIQDKSNQWSHWEKAVKYVTPTASLWPACEAHTFRLATKTTATSSNSGPRQIMNKRARIPWRLQEETQDCSRVFSWWKKIIEKRSGISAITVDKIQSSGKHLNSFVFRENRFKKLANLYLALLLLDLNLQKAKKVSRLAQNTAFTLKRRIKNQLPISKGYWKKYIHNKVHVCNVLSSKHISVYFYVYIYTHICKKQIIINDMQRTHGLNFFPMIPFNMNEKDGHQTKFDTLPHNCHWITNCVYYIFKTIHAVCYPDSQFL